MMFLFKKIIAPFFFPLSICIILFLIGFLLLWFKRKQKAGKLVVSMGILFLLSISYGFVFSLPLASLEKRYPPLIDFASLSDIRWVVVLGGGHTSDPNFPATSQISPASLTRLVEGIRIHKNLPGSKIILSGGKGFDPVPNARIMADVASILGINENDIVLEPTAKDTHEEALSIKRIVKKNKFILVTTASHMPRAMALFKKIDLHPIPAPTDYMLKYEQMTSPATFFPRSNRIRNAETVFHEFLGLLWAKLRGQV